MTTQVFGRCILLLAAIVCTGLSNVQAEVPIAYAAPVEGLTIDGDLGDWPEDPILYPILNHGQFYGPTDIDDVDLAVSADLSPKFMVGYDAEVNLLYLAVQVRDDRLKVGGTHHKQTDACELYIDGDHSGEQRILSLNMNPAEVAAMQYIGIPGYGSYDSGAHPANPALNFGDISTTRSRMSYSRQGDTTVYEWAIEVFDQYPDNPSALATGKVIGLDIAIVDKDTDVDIPAWVCWGPLGTSKYLNANLLGDVVLIKNRAELGSVGGRITDSTGQLALGGVKVYLEGASGVGKGWAVSDDDGHYRIWGTSGQYRTLVKDARSVKPISVEIKAGHNVTDADFAIEYQTPSRMSGLLNPNWIFKIGVGALTAFAVLHVLLFIYYPRLPENLYYAIFTFCTAAMVFLNFQTDFAAIDQEGQLWYDKSFRTAVILAVMAGMRFLNDVVYRRLVKPFWAFTALAIAMIAWIWLGNPNAMFVFVFLAFPEMARITIASIRHEQGGAWFIGLGFLGFICLGVYQGLMVINVLQWVSEYVYIYGILGLLISMSVYLARNFALTNANLETQLTEVKRLSEEKLAQERRAREEEISRRVLESENERRGQELEEARQLQLSMLPQSLPDIGGIDIAWNMTTASEVGGDYYDYYESGEGVITVVLGDATGHGLRAGIVVTVAKALLNQMGHQEDIGQMLMEMSDKLRQMNLGRNHMALMLVRVMDNCVQVTSAGIPPLLHYKRSTKTAEEVLIGGPPLGAMRKPSYQTLELSFEPGDSLLMMTDGFAERENAGGEILGFERALEHFAQIAQKSAGEICSILSAEGDRWAQGKDQEDDVTFVALKRMET